jgi:hypothetical protein
MAVLVKMSPVMADRSLVHLIYRLVIRPIPTVLIGELPERRQYSIIHRKDRLYGSCTNGHTFTARDSCDICLGLSKRYFNEDYILAFVTPVFTINDVTFSIGESAVTIKSKYNTMQFNSYHIGRMSIKVIGDLAYILTGYEFTILCLRYGRVLRQWHDRRHDKEYLGGEANFRDHPLNFIVEPNGLITINGPYRTYWIRYEN